MSGPDDRTTLLETRDVSIRFGGVQALRDVNLRVDQWEIVGIIGPNGAGKTTLFNCITGFYEPTSGRVHYRDRDVTDLPVHQRTDLGIGRTFQNVGLVKGTTALENLKTAQHLEVDYDPVAGIFGSPRTFEVERHITERARAILDLMGLAHLEGTRVQGLPYGVLKRLELAAVLATDPDLLLLDEPGSGMGPEEAEELGDLLLRLREEFELTIVMIDHHVPLVTRISDYMYCLNFGEVLAEGLPDDVRRHPEVVRAYLGDDPGGGGLMALLEVDSLVVGYGFPVLHGISFEVEEGETAVLFGLNGAGKTTTVTTIAGLLRPDAGSIRFGGTEIQGRPPSGLVADGISLSPEGRRVFPRLSVADNLRMGAWVRRRDRGVADEQQRLVFDYFPRLAERAGQLAGTLSGGEQQMLAIGRALMSRPRLLLIDEASLGLSPTLAKTVFQVVSRINDDGVTVLIVEQNVGVLPYADRALIMEQGTLIYTGVGDEIRSANLRETYLGA